jgi:cation diffusion facilitator CzcD-associated flavoprotein CzcO
VALTTDAGDITIDRTAAESGGPTPHVRVAIIGTGFAGLGMAIRLLDAGERDIVLLERADDVGGTWRDNTYPGCQCDVPSHLYSFSFAPNADWSRSFGLQSEIRAYLRDTAERFGVIPHIRFRSELLEARWDAAAQHWHLTTTTGTLTATILVSGHGPLSEPKYPTIPGLETFEGTTFHSAAWQHDHDLTDRKVAVIGTGASAIQFVPAIQPQVEELNLYQRTPAWVVPRPDRPIPERTRARLRRHPQLLKARRAGIYWSRELIVVAMAKKPRLMNVAQKVARKHLALQVKDPVLRAKLTPDYSIGCKRVLLSNEYFPAVSKPNVDVITTGIREVTPTSIIAADGTEREVDTIIFGTGFQVTDQPIGRRIIGATGATLTETWAETMQAYLGATVSGFPNFFMVAGPNTGLGHTSMVVMMEAQFAYILDALETMKERGLATIDVRRDVQAAYNEGLQRDLEGTVWSSGCSSWYLDAKGNNTTLWPTFTFTFRKRTRHFDADSYTLTAKRAAKVRA